MQDKLKVAVLGTGQMGSGVVRLLMRKQGVELVGVYGRRADRAGIDVGEAIGLDGKIERAETVSYDSITYNHHFTGLENGQRFTD